MDYRYTFDSILQGSSKKRLDFEQQFSVFLLCFKVFWFFFLGCKLQEDRYDWCIPKLKCQKKVRKNIIGDYFTAPCLFSTPLYKVSIKLFTRSARISQKRFVSSEVHLWDVCFFSILSVLFDSISSLGSKYFRIYRRSL